MYPSAPGRKYMDLLQANMIIINSKPDWYLRLRNNIYSLMEYRRSEADLCRYYASKTFLNFQQTRELIFCLWIKYWIEYLRTATKIMNTSTYRTLSFKLLFWLNLCRKSMYSVCMFSMFCLCTRLWNGSKLSEEKRTMWMRMRKTSIGMPEKFKPF